MAVQLNFASHLDFHYNSLNADAGHIGIGLYVSNLASKQISLLNNSIAYTGAGAEGRAMHANDAFENFTAIDYNNYYSTGGRFVYFNKGFRTDLAQLQASVTSGYVHDMNSWALNPIYQSATDLHLDAGSPLDDKGTPVAVTVDFGGQLRSTTSPTIGADELGTSLRYAVKEQVDVKVYPNPFRSELKVDVTGMEGEVELTLTDMMGRQVYSSKHNASANVLLVTPQVQLSQGVYMLQVSNNGVTSRFRVVKQ